ncbi:hypothetical protein GE543_27435, partial [Pseudomonas sp. SZ57]|nr:hypothetical protein [Pseudomonas sp. SZ57]
MIIVPTLRVGMQFVTLCVTQRFCDIRWIRVRLKSPFRPSATYIDGAKVGKARSSVSGPTSSGSFAQSLIRGAPQPARLP